MIPNVTVHVDGLAGLEQRLFAQVQARYAESVEIAVVTGGTRGASKNALIARVQSAYGRNPFYLNAKTLQVIRAAARGLFGAAGTAKRTSDSIGAAMLVSINENVGKQQNPDGGKFAELTTGYARRKQAKWGFVKPILRASGDLLGGLRVRVTRGGVR